MKENKENSSPSATSANLDHTNPCWYWDKKGLAHSPHSWKDSIQPLRPGTAERVLGSSLMWAHAWDYTMIPWQLE